MFDKHAKQGNGHKMKEAKREKDLKCSYFMYNCDCHKYNTLQYNKGLAQNFNPPNFMLTSGIHINIITQRKANTLRFLSDITSSPQNQNEENVGFKHITVLFSMKQT